MPTKTSPAKAEAVLLRADNLAHERWLAHAFSTRKPPGAARARNDFNLGYTEGTPRATTDRNRATFIAVLANQQHWQLAGVKQIHSDIIHVLRTAPAELPAGDGLVTNVPGLLLSVKTADCLPVLLADPKHRAVGAFHAGWRGTLARIVEKGVGVMRREFGGDAAQLVAAIGPGIHACSYEVSDDVRDQFASQFAYAAELFAENFDVDPVRRKYPLLFMNARAPGHAEVSRQLHLDLVEANRRQLLAAGVRAENIWTSPLCTACRTDLLFSHRAEHGKTGRMMSVIGIVKSEGTH